MDNQIPYDILLDGEIGILRYLGNIIGLLNKYIRQKWLEKGISIDYKNIQGESNLGKSITAITKYIREIYINNIHAVQLKYLRLFPDIVNIHIEYKCKYPRGDKKLAYLSVINRIISNFPTTCNIDIIIPPKNMDGFFITSITHSPFRAARYITATMYEFCRRFEKQILERMIVSVPSHNIILRPGDREMPKILIENSPN